MCPTRIHSGKDSFSLSYIGDLLMTLSPEDSLEREASSAEKLEMDFCIPGGGGGGWGVFFLVFGVLVGGEGSKKVRREC